MSHRTKIYFLSDLHLGYRDGAAERARERRIVRFLREHVAADGAELFLLGDVLDFWFEYRNAAPQGHTRFLGALAELADSGVEVHWIAGNHDMWLARYLADEIGMHLHSTDGRGIFIRRQGRQLYLAHGDTFGRLPVGARALGRIFRNRLCRALFAAVHPRWGIGLAHRWSRHSGRYTRIPETLPPHVRTRLELASRSLVAEHPDLDYIILGHYHVRLDEPVGPHTRLAILGESFSHISWAEMEAGTLSLHVEK